MEIFKTTDFWYFLITLVVGTIVTFWIYFLGKSLKDDKKHLLILFKANQKISTEIQVNLKNFINEFNADNAIAFPERNLTYGIWLETMIAEYNSNLSDELYEFIKSQKLTKPNIQSMTESLNKQNENLRLLDIDMKLVINRARDKAVNFKFL
jgi:hypothetical protein